MRAGPVIAGVHRGPQQGKKEPDKRVVSWSWNSSDGGPTPPASTKLAGGVVRVATQMHGTGTFSVQGRAQENMPPTHLGVVTVAGKGAWQTAPAGRPWSGALEGCQDGSDTGRSIATKYRQELPLVFSSQCTGLRAGQPPPWQQGGGKSELHRAPYGVTPRHAPGRDD